MFSMQKVFAAKGAIFVSLKTVRVFLFVFPGGIISPFALRTRHHDDFLHRTHPTFLFLLLLMNNRVLRSGVKKFLLRKNTAYFFESKKWLEGRFKKVYRKFTSIFHSPRLRRPFYPPPEWQNVIPFPSPRV